MIQDPLLSWWRRRGGVTAKARLESRSRYALTVAWITVTLLIAVFVPDISKVIGVIGGISAFFIFIFPGEALVAGSSVQYFYFFLLKFVLPSAGLCLVFAVRSEPVSCRTR